MFTALLDSCVLWPSTLRDFLLSLAIEQAYTPAWSSAILDEVERNEVIKLHSRPPHLDAAKAELRAATLIRMMRRAFPDAETQGWEMLDGKFGLPDIDDEHVLAAAVLSRSGAIVTENLKHFPPALVPAGIQVLTARQFTENTVSMNPGLAMRAVTAVATRSGKHGPEQGERAILEILENRYRLTEAVEMMRAAHSL